MAKAPEFKVLDPAWLAESAKHPWTVVVEGVPDADDLHDHEVVQTQTLTIDQDGHWWAIDSWGGDMKLKDSEDAARFVRTFFREIHLVSRCNPDDENEKKETDREAICWRLVQEIELKGLAAVSIRCLTCGALLGWRPADSGSGTADTCGSKYCKRERKKAAAAQKKQARRAERERAAETQPRA